MTRIEYILKMEFDKDLLANIFENNSGLVVFQIYLLRVHCSIPSLKYIKFLPLNRSETI